MKVSELVKEAEQFPPCEYGGDPEVRAILRNTGLSGSRKWKAVQVLKRLCSAHDPEAPQRRLLRECQKCRARKEPEQNTSKT